MQSGWLIALTLGKRMLTQDTPLTSYGEWLLLNGKTSLDDLESICQEFFPFVYDLALIFIDNAEYSRRSSFEALARALLASRRYPGGAVHAWLARYTLLACRQCKTTTDRNYRWADPTDYPETICWSLIVSLDRELQVQAVLFYRFNLSRQDIARICNLPQWLVNHNLNLVRELCTRRFLWAGNPLSPIEVEEIIRGTLEHQLAGVISDPDQRHQLALDLASTIHRQKNHQRRVIYLRQAAIFLVCIAVLVIFILK